MVARADRDREEEADHRERASGQQPLQLLAPVTARAAVEDDLADDPRERDREEEEHDDGEAGAAAAAAAELLELAGGVDPDRVLGEGAEVRDHEVADQHGHERDVHPERPTPPPRDLAVGEEEDRQRQEHEHRGPPLSQEDGEPRERKAVVIDVVGADGVEAGVGAVGRSDGDREEEPADRVPRLPARDERTDGRERDHQQQLPDPAEGELVRERRQRETRHDQQCGGSARARVRGASADVLARSSLDPDADVGGLERGAGRGRELVEDGVDVDGVPQARRERGDGRLGVVVRPVEAAVDAALDPAAERVEERERGERRGGDADRARRTAARASSAGRAPRRRRPAARSAARTRACARSAGRSRTDGSG